MTTRPFDRWQGLPADHWRALSPAERERAYMPSSMVASLADEIAAYTEGSAAARRALPFQTHAYGDHPDELLDLVPAPAPGAPLHVFIHGGYWQELTKDESSFMAPAIVAGGAAFATVNYTLAPAASLDRIVDQCVRAVAWCAANATRFGADPERILVSGSSAGAHLAVMVLTRIDRVAGAALLSGVYDLEPLLSTSVNQALGLEAAEARRLSPIHLRPRRPVPLVVAVGEIETAEFHRQSARFATAWAAHGCPATEVLAQGRHHFDLPNDLGRGETALGAAVGELLHGRGHSGR